MFIHVNDAIRQGHTNVMIWTIDTDVVVLAIKFFIAINNGLLQCIFKTVMPGLRNLLIGFGKSSHYRLICSASFVGHGKSQCFKVWDNKPQFDSTFRELSTPGIELTENS